MYQLELEVTRLQKLLDIICTDHSIQHTIAVEKMKAERKEVPINESIKYASELGNNRWLPRAEFRSNRYTTNWSELLII